MPKKKRGSGFSVLKAGTAKSGGRHHKTGVSN